MAKLQEMWVEHHAGSNPAIRIVWDNDRHQRIEIKGRNPLDVIRALEMVILNLESELYHNEI